ncbi:MAG: proline--tRNA ligase [Candidatus Omnitrophota bacterium]
MYWSNAFIPTLKETPKDAEAISHKLMLRAGLVKMLTAGVYLYLPLGLKVLNNIENIIRDEMDRVGANEVYLSCLQPRDIWLKSGRDAQMQDVMIKFTDRKNRELCLGPTHEEVITELVKSYVNSYKQLPITLYQIQTKFRDETRPRFGLIRSCEFIMKDAYSFDKDKIGLEKNYKFMYEAYVNIFKRCGLDVKIIQADPGVMGGSVSHEFLVPAESGEDTVEGKPAIEIAHIFQLGIKYSQALGANFLDKDGKLNPIIMGCYGIGVSRLIAAIIEQNYDDKGIIWPREVAPYDILITAVNFQDDVIRNISQKVYSQLKDSGMNVLIDDRSLPAGVKFNDAELIGVPIIIVIGKKTIENNTIEIKIRSNGKKFDFNVGAQNTTSLLDKLRELKCI